MGEVGPDRAVDADVDLHVPEQRRELGRSHGLVLLVIAVGGGLGAVARYGVAELLPGGRFPWGTFAANVSGCFLIGVLMVAVTEVWTGHPLARPFFGVGVLGGYTTFSTHAGEARGLLAAGNVVAGFAYLGATLLGALLAVCAGVYLARLSTRKHLLRSAAR